MEENEEKIEYLEDKIEELTKLTKQNNKMLKRRRNINLLRTIILSAISIASLVFIYIVYSTYKEDIEVFKENASNIISQFNEVIETGGELKDSVDSFKDAISGDDEEL